MYALSRRVRLLLHALDGFVLTAVGSLVLLHIAPRAVALGGLWSLALGGIGLLLPALFERMVFGRGTRGWAIALGLLGLASHTLIDGAAIGAERELGSLSWAIVLHRLPAGILVWWLVRPAFGLKRASFMLAGLVLATIAGFLLGQRFDFLEERSLALFEAFVAGALLHVLLSHGPELHGEEGPHNRVAELFGAALGVLMVVLVPDSSGHEHAPSALGPTGAELSSLAGAIALPLIAGLAAAGFLATTPTRLRGLLRAIVHPVGASGAAREFAERRDLLALAATPQLGPAALLISLVLLGPLLTAIRFVAAIVASLAVFAILRKKIEPQADLHSPEPADWRARGTAALRFGFRDLMDESAAWILVGVAANLLLTGTSVDVHWLISIPIAALVALFPFVCAIGATPLVAGAVGAGLSVGTALAFLISGSMVHLTALAAIQKQIDRRAAVTYAVASFAIAVAIGMAADLLWPEVALPAPSLGLEGSVDRAAAILLLTLIAAALVRLGPRGFVQTLLRPAQRGAPEEDHHHHHHHA